MIGGKNEKMIEDLKSEKLESGESQHFYGFEFWSHCVRIVQGSVAESCRFVSKSMLFLIKFKRGLLWLLLCKQKNKHKKRGLGHFVFIFILCLRLLSTSIDPLVWNMMDRILFLLWVNN